MPLALVLAVALVLGMLLASRQARAGERIVTLDDLYQQHAKTFGVDWRLVKAIAQHESRENQLAVNKADNESIGLMQILCRPDGRGGCSNKLNVQGWNTATRAKLLDADFNIYIGAQILSSNIAAYGVAKGIAVYNAWDQHAAPTAGPFKNQAYVDDVLARARSLGWTA